MQRRFLTWMVLAAASTARAATIHVDVANCPDPGDGTAGDPYCSIQTAIDNAADDDEIVVAPGTYLEMIDFLGKAIWLHGSDGAAVTIIDGGGLGTVVTCTSGEGPDTILEGLTITGGSATDGGGMVSSGSSPTIRSCRFANNSAANMGGAIFGCADLVVTDCLFSANSADFGGAIQGTCDLTVTRCAFVGNAGGVGGAIEMLSGDTLTVTDSVFANNGIQAVGGGSAIFRTGGETVVTNCTFSANHSSEAALLCLGSTLTCVDSVFAGNVGTFQGGGIDDLASNSTLIANCLFAGNSGAGIQTTTDEGSFAAVNCTFVSNVPAGIQTESDGFAHVFNCVLRQNSPYQITGDPAGTPPNATVFFSDVQGGWTGPGSGNIDLPPQFVGGPTGTWTSQAVYDPATGLTTFFDSNAAFIPGELAGTGLLDPIFASGRRSPVAFNTATEMSVYGDFAVFGQPGFTYRLFDYRLSPDSPCIDAADNTAVPQEITTDLDGYPRFLDIPETPDTGNGDPPIVDMGAYESLGGGCLAVVSESVTCNPSGLSFSYDVEAINPCTGETQTITFPASGGAVGEDFCFTVMVTGEQGGPCCSTQLCVPVPDCAPPPHPPFGLGARDLIDRLIELAVRAGDS